jgi:1-acyl-sn-glycerol-3-phosphate acyltransferase
MTINGSFEILPRQRDWHFIKRRPITLTIHEPLYPLSKGQENIRRMSEESYRIIQSALEPKYQD